VKKTFPAPAVLPFANFVAVLGCRDSQDLNGKIHLKEKK
jgi:hypothetical protein